MISEFDEHAQEWDNNLDHIRRTEAIAAAILERIPLHRQMRAMEYGAGTGLLSFMLQDRLAQITMMDSSKEMVRVAQQKIDSRNLSHLNTVWLNLEKEEFAGQFDLIFNQMVLHHVENIDLVFQKFAQLLHPGGYLAIADLYREDGSFHGEGFTGHRGFDVDQLSQKLRRLGFNHIEHRQCYTMVRGDENGIIREYPLFLLTASKN